MIGGLARIVLTLVALARNLDNSKDVIQKLGYQVYASSPIADPYAPLYFHAWKVV